MPIKAVKPDVAAAINRLTSLLKRDYGCDFAYTVMGRGFVLAQHNIAGVNQPVPLVEHNPDDNWANDSIQFPRLIAEIEACGGFTSRLTTALKTEMDLNTGELMQLVGRAQTSWDEIKKQTLTFK